MRHALLLGALLAFAAPLARAEDEKPVAAEDKPVLDQLEKDFDDLSAKLDAAKRARLRDARRVLEGTDRSAHWFAYFEGMKIVRELRVKAAVPLLLRESYLHATTGIPEEAFRVLKLLTGKTLDVPARRDAAAWREAIVKAARDWWTPGKDAIETDLEKLGTKERDVVVEELLATEKWLCHTHDEKDTAKAVGHVFESFIDREDHQEHPSRYVRATDVAAWMVEPILARGESKELRYAAVRLLAIMRKARRAPGLEKVVKDEKRSPGARFVADLALVRAGESLIAPPLAGLLKVIDPGQSTEERGDPPVSLDLRLGIIIALGRARDAKEVLSTLAEQVQDRDPEVRAAASAALEKLKVEVSERHESLKNDPERGDAAHDLLDRLHKDWVELARKLDEPTRRRFDEARRLLEAREGEVSRIPGESASRGLAVLRQTRVKAAVPYLLEQAYVHADEGPMLTCLAVLAGKDVVLELGGDARGRREAIAAVASDWWFAEKGSIETTYGKLPPRERKVVVATLMRLASQARWGTVSTPDGTPAAIAASMDGLERLEDARESRLATLYPEDVTAAMVEPLLAAAAESAEQRLDAIVLLALMRKNRKAPGLEKVVADAARAPEARIAASLALWRAGEKAAKADSLVALLRSCPVDRDTKEETQERAAASSPVSHEARLWLMHAIARTKDARSLDALSEQAEDRDETVRATALLALSKLGLDRVPKVLERLTRDPDWSSPEIALALASIKDDPDARRRIYERLERAASAVESGKTSALSLGQLLNVIAGLRGEHALYNASPTCDSAYLENAREALLVWKRERR